MNETSDIPSIRRADDREAFALAIELLSRGDCVAVPTETVYGLAADATNGEAVAKIFATKDRPAFNPLIAHVPDLAMAARLAEIGEIERQLMERFWPGPLTLVCPLRPKSPIHPLATAGLRTIGLRCPNGVMAELARVLDRPLAAPSANRSGRVSPTSAVHVAASLGERVSLILDGGPTSVGLESTIIRVETDRIVILRPGGISREALVEASMLPVEAEADGAAISAPGQLSSHYAPTGVVRLNATAVAAHEWLIAFGPEPISGQNEARGVIQLSRTADLREAAANLFGALAAVDRSDIAAIAVMPIPFDGLGDAINDRLRRAAAPRRR